MYLLLLRNKLLKNNIISNTINYNKSYHIYTKCINSNDLNELNFILIENFITEEEEKLCIDYVNNKLKIRRYQSKIFLLMLCIY